MTCMDEFAAAKTLLSSIHIERPCIVDGGACVGYTIIECFKFWPEAKVYAFEARPDLCTYLEKLFEKNKNVTIYNELLGQKNETMEFNVTRDVVTGSVLKPGAIVKQYHKEKMDIINTIVLNCVTLDDSFSKLDLIKLDLHGAELPTLKGSIEILPQIKIIIVEMSFYEVFIGQAPFYELSKFICEQGFDLFSLYNLAYNPASGKLGGGNALFTNKRFLTPS
jgi:FkbM family methyltransferase